MIDQWRKYMNPISFTSVAAARGWSGHRRFLPLARCSYTCSVYVQPSTVKCSAVVPVISKVLFHVQRLCSTFNRLLLLSLQFNNLNILDFVTSPWQKLSHKQQILSRARVSTVARASCLWPTLCAFGLYLFFFWWLILSSQVLVITWEVFAT